MCLLSDKTVIASEFAAKTGVQSSKIQDHPAADDQVLVNNLSVSASESSDDMTKEGMGSDTLARDEPDHFDFVDAMIALTLKLQAEKQIAISLTTQPAYSAEVYEPLRRCTHFAPPKRFHRTFWRSLARRALAASMAVE